MRNTPSIVGRKFGRLLVVSYEGSKPVGTTRKSIWGCLCDCGNSLPEVLRESLVNGNTMSCGCYAKEKAGSGMRTHGKSKTPEYGVWCWLIDRCERTANKSYKDYGGRGISVCRRWRNSFEAFLSDMGERPSPKHSIERRNVNGNYTPKNCYWGTIKQQARNKRNNRLIEFKGETKCLAAWAEEIGISQDLIWGRLKRGWSVERTLTTPLLKRNQWSTRSIKLRLVG